jgi:hypothetical protein
LFPAREWRPKRLPSAGAEEPSTGLEDLGGNDASNLRCRVVFSGLALGAVVFFTARWWQGERRLGPVGFTPKRRYLFATAVLFVVILVSPIVGLIGYVGAHALEYFVIVHGALGRRYTGPGSEPGGAVGLAVRSRLRATGCVILYVVVVGAALVFVTRRVSPNVGNVILLSVGGMHVFFDGFICKLRRPIVA